MLFAIAGGWRGDVKRMGLLGFRSVDFALHAGLVVLLFGGVLFADRIADSLWTFKNKGV